MLDEEMQLPITRIQFEDFISLVSEVAKEDNSLSLVFPNGQERSIRSEHGVAWRIQGDVCVVSGMRETECLELAEASEEDID